MRLTCRVCGSSIPREDIHEDFNLARCRNCASVQDLSAKSGPGRTRSPTPPAPVFDSPVQPAAVPLRGGGMLSDPIDVPDGFRVSEGKPFRIAWRWYGPRSVIGLIGALLFNGVLAFMFVGTPAGRSPVVDLFLPAGAIALYRALLQFTNSTRLELSDAELRIRVGPLPWFGRRTLETADLQQLWVREVEHRNKGRVTHRTYDVRARTRNTMDLRLITGLHQPFDAFWLEHELEYQLGLEDEQVPGAMQAG